MARYNTFKYGDGTLYGTEALGIDDSSLLWSVLVDWDADGYYTGENEAPKMVNFSLTRGRDSYIRSDGQGFERYGIGRVTLTLDNDDGRYNPFNINSPLYPNVVPGKRVRIAVLDRNTSTNHSLMRGVIADIQPFNQGTRKMVRIEVVDGQQFLQGKTVKIGIRGGTPPPWPSAFNTVGSWVDLILERANWPADEWPRTYDSIEDANGNQLGVSFTENFYRWLKFAWFWLRDAYDAVAEMENTELGTFLHARDGSARFLSSHFSYDKVVEISESQILRDITTPQPWEVIRNKIEVKVHYIFSSGIASTVLWKIGGTGNDAIFIAARSQKVFEAQFKYQNFDVVPDTGVGGYQINKTVNSNTAGTGTDLSSQCTIDIGEYGDGATLTLTNNSSTNGYIINLSLQAVPIYSPTATIVSSEDSASQNTYGLKVFRLESPWQQEHDWVDILKTLLINVLKSPTQYPIIKIEHRPDIQFALDLYVDAIHLEADTLGINAFYRIGKIEHQWLNPNGSAVLTTLKLEPYFALDAQAEIDFDLLSPLDSNDPGGHTSDEIGCMGSPPTGRMKFCLEEVTEDVESWEYIDGSADHTYGNWTPPDGVNGLVLGRFNGPNEMDMTSVNLSYTIVADCVFVFWYQWGGTDNESASAEPVLIILSTTESGVIYSQALPFRVVVSESYMQHIIDLSAYAGETLTSIVFRKQASFDSQGTALLRIDDIGLGKLIYSGEN